ncbi:MAG: uroporphyrinogen decarboxylase [Candidatus Binatia bacterium]|nr:MAG: uroporphyrinogen decarboxylase [Candidatus Binatia bacterium]
MASVFLQACRRESTPYTPVWLMRQAGRYIPRYREIRNRLSFLEMCKNVEVATEVTLLPVRLFRVDAAIVFADILLLLEPLDVGLTFLEGEGPRVRKTVRSGEDVARLREFDVAGELSYVFEILRNVRASLPPDVALIGFAGAPFTVASYLVEGRGSRLHLETKEFLYREPDAWHDLLACLGRLTVRYLEGQIEAGAQAVQLFDSWAGCLAPDDYREFVLPHTRSVVEALGTRVPVILFSTGTAGLLRELRETGAQVIGLDWRLDLARAWDVLGAQVAVQGNLDPAVLLASPERIRDAAARLLRSLAGRRGHIFNLGHGVLPATPVEHVRLLVETVRRWRPT